MDFQTYKEQVKRTLPNLPEFNGNKVILDSIHMCLGMFSEIYELEEGLMNGDEVNVAEELTDIAWYACNYCNVRGIEPLSELSLEEPLLEPNGDKILQNRERIILAISELQDYDKKELAYNKPESEEIKTKRISLINTIINNLDFCYYYASIDCEKAMQNNIDKLKKRFPADKFDEEKAKNRNLADERKELEK